MSITRIVRLLAAALLWFPQALAAQDPTPAVPPNAIASITVRRCDANPLITFKTSKSLGNNINGPSVIKVPSWIKDPLGKYYMYFAHHGGAYIRLAYADAPQGPWRIHEPGTLTLKQAEGFSGHIASPDVHVDEQKQEIRMYFHGGRPNGGQSTAVAISKDGLAFAASRELLGGNYFRVFQRGDFHYAVRKGAELSRSNDGLTRFEKHDGLIPKLRHAALLILGDQLLCFYSRTGDEPERILVSTIALTGDWKTWRASEPIEVIQPEMDYEGIAFPLKPSKSGSGTNVRELRDPCILQADGRTYLYYSIAGECGIAMAELEMVMK